MTQRKILPQHAYRPLVSVYNAVHGWLFAIAHFLTELHFWQQGM